MISKALPLTQQLLAAVLVVVISVHAAADESDTSAEQTWQKNVRPLLNRYCFECHADEVAEAEIDLAAFQSFSDVDRNVVAWLKVREMLDSGQMPPKDAPQPPDDERLRLKTWVRDFLAQKALAQAGDPGPVVLRRLSNAEYTYTIHDLTGIESLQPAREFPVDGAAGEGFTNTGSGLVMSPSLVQKYLDAAKEIARHAAFYPDGVRFSPYTSRRDLTDELLAKLQAFYGRYTTSGNGSAVNLQGIQFATNQGGVLPLVDYLTAAVVERDALRAGTRTVADVAKERQLSPVYLTALWKAFVEEQEPQSFLMRQMRDRWQQARPNDISQVVAHIAAWQSLLWKFNVVGHVGREGAPGSWMEPVEPMVERQEFRLKLPESPDGEDVVVYLSAGDAGDGNENDYVLWRDMRLESLGNTTVNLRDVRGVHQRITEARRELLNDTTKYLEAVRRLTGDARVADVAKEHAVDPILLGVWANYISVDHGGPVTVMGHLSHQQTNGTYGFVTGWEVPGLPSVVANSSDQQVRIPGIARPHSLVAHPSPTMFAAIGWRSPFDGVVKVTAAVSDAHPECGNGIQWFVQHRSGDVASTLAEGGFATGGSATIPPRTIAVRKGELISLIIGPREGNHACDLTATDLTITETDGAKRSWDAARDNSSNLLAGNPHADSHGNDDVWHFYQGPVSAVDASRPSRLTLPPGSVLARWKGATDAAERSELAQQVAQLAMGPPLEGDQRHTPDGLLWQQLQALTVPLTDDLVNRVERDQRFGTHPLGHTIDSNHLVVRAPATTEFHIPSELAKGRELVLVGMYDVGHGREGTTHLNVGTSLPADGSSSGSTIVCAPDSKACERVREAFREFRELFPPALCYTRIVPVDEVVTATLFHREDELFRRLMLDQHQAAELDRLWQELYYVSEEPLKLVVALEQIREFSTQDRPEMVEPWDRMKPAVQARAEAFRKHVMETQPKHLEWLSAFAGRAWRRPLSEDEQLGLLDLYQSLRDTEISHEDAVRLVIARVLTSPTFLYRREMPVDGLEPGPVTGLELANRLSYFLWSSMPDDELRRAAESGQLSGRNGDAELLKQTRRMLRDPRVQRLAIQFACQWLHLRDFDQNDDKNETLYPQFAELRGDMYQETVRFFEDMFRNDGSILDILNADHTFVNGALARHYGMTDITDMSWARVNGVRARSRGGVLGMAAFLASQSGASRTSPILRGNWISETLLGERLPRPPANVPQLPEAVPPGLTARQLIEHHTSKPACAKCHLRIDPYGFALEQYDAIGRVRPVSVDTQTTLLEGRTIEGIEGLRNYLLTDRRDDVVRQFCRKLLGYALGREVQLSDEPLIADLQKRLNSHDYRFRVALESVVLSRQFRDVRGRETDSFK